MAKKHDTRILMTAVGSVSPQELAELLGDLRYDCLGEYLEALAEKLQRDSEGDGGRGRGKLAGCLARTAFNLDDAAVEIRAAWQICLPYMKVSNTDK